MILFQSLFKEVFFKRGNPILTIILVAILFSCKQAPIKSEFEKEEPATILSPAGEPALSPQSLKVQGRFLLEINEKDSSIEEGMKLFIVSNVISLSSSLIKIVGQSDTLSLRLSSAQKRIVEEKNRLGELSFQCILQEKMQLGMDGVIYSVKDIQSIRHSK